jgi:hypothetical protein
MKILKKNLLKTVIGAGMVLAPATAHAQAVSRLDLSSERFVGGGATYTLNMAPGTYNAGVILNYGLLEEVCDDNGGFRGVAVLNAYGLANNSYINNKNMQTYGAGFVFKFGAGWKGIALTASKRYMLAMNRDKSYLFANEHALGGMIRVGEYTRLYGDFVISEQRQVLNEKTYKHMVEIGIIHTLRRDQQGK